MAVRSIYMIGICGVAMGTLAALFHESGFAVSGSDSNMYPPMSDILQRSGIELFNGYSADNVKAPDLVIIGNAISRGNPEVELVLNKKIPYLSMAQAIYNFFLKDREIIAVAGTHGKSTTTALLAHILESAGRSPSFLVGGVTRNYDSNYRIGTGRQFVIEGDEYDSAFFEKVPKFMMYRPDHLIITSLEFDHADIYQNLGEIELWFRRLVNIIPSNGSIVYSSEYPNLMTILSASRSKTYSFGSAGSDYRFSFGKFHGDYTEFVAETPRGVIELETQLFGHFNYGNIIAAVSMAQILGIEEGDIKKAVKSFEGVKRRQELIYSRDSVKIYEDFAHHPTAIRCVLETMKERYPGARLWAVYEPRSATARRNVFQDVLPAAFESADEIIIKTPFEGSAIDNNKKLDAAKLLYDIRDNNHNSFLCASVDDILAHISNEINTAVPNVIVLMSNGGFDGIYDRLKVMMDRLMARN